jgi:hypothetical protein
MGLQTLHVDHVVHHERSHKVRPGSLSRLCVWMRKRTTILLLSFVLSCSSEKDGLLRPPPLVEFGDSGLSVDDSGLTDPDDTGLPAIPCEETGGDVIPADVEWMVFDGLSSDLFSLADGVLQSEWVGQEGTYNLNDAPVQGANGFKLERPGTVVGVAARWAQLPAEAAAVPVLLWPDFGSDGYMWDAENPSRSPTRCLSTDDEGEWVEYALSEPITVDQPLHVFAGYATESSAVGPALLQEDTWFEGDPPFAGIRFLGVDDGIYHLGMASPWYTWQVRLAVVYDEALSPAEKPFQIDDALAGAGRMAWGDYDNDGDDDVMISGPSLFRNEGDGSFTDVSATAIIGAGASGGGVWGDYDNDGCLDYFGQGGSYSAGEVLLHNNCDGTLVDVIAASGIDDTQTQRDCNGDGEAEFSPTEGVAWADVDGDGLLDLVQANYECGSDFDFFKNYDDFLWRNNGDGTFSDWTAISGLDQTNQAGRGVTTGDPDLDGDTDIFVSNYRLDRNFFYENNGDGTFAEISGSNGTRGHVSMGAYGHTIGAQFGDIDNDGDLDMVHANLAHPFYAHFSDKTMVLINDGDGFFSDEAEERGIYYRETHSNPVLFDADNDGDLDLFITSVYGGRDSDFYRNDGEGYFQLDNYASGLLVHNGWGAAVADYDNDGDVDVFSRALHRNDSDNSNQWLQIKLVGGAGEGGLANRSAIGSTVEISTTGGTQMRQVSGGSGTSVQDSMVSHFGLGVDATADLYITFTGGNTVTLSAVTAGQRLWVHEDGRTSSGVIPPSW